MKFLYCLLFIHCVCSFAFSQPVQKNVNKPPIGFDTFGAWPTILNISISDDGQYVLYKVNYPSQNVDKIHLVALNRQWNLAQSATSCQFLEGGKYAVLKNLHDSLLYITLESGKIDYILDVASFKVAGKNGTHLIYSLKSRPAVVIKNIQTQQTIVVDSVKEYYTSENGPGLLLKKVEGALTALLWVDLENLTWKIIWQSTDGLTNTSYFQFSRTGSQLVFLVEDRNKTPLRKAVWYFAGNGEEAENLTGFNLINQPGMEINSLVYNGITKDGKHLFLTLKEKSDNEVAANLPKVDVWSYKDPKLQSQQQKEFNSRIYTATINLENHSLYQLENDSLKIILKNEQYVVLAKREGADNEWHWNESSKADIYLVFLNDSSRRLINKNQSGTFQNIAASYFLTPGGKFLIYYNPEERNYFSYEIQSGVRRNLTSSIKGKWTTYIPSGISASAYMPIGIAGTVKDDRAILLYDQCDIFQVDPTLKKEAINITNSFGTKNNIEFRLALETPKIFEPNEDVVLSAFHRKNKNDGFYRIRLGEKNNPVLLVSQPYSFKGTLEDDRFTPVAPIKAKNAPVYLVRRMSASEYPNYFYTTDFKSFREVTNLHPEAGYNWIKSELITWKKDTNGIEQGILYKPENFDPNKKYPVIFFYYENLTEGLHGFLMPEFTAGALNISYYVSNGYLVFAPDIHYSIGHPGKSVLATIVSAAKYLNKLPYFDAKHIGLQGHSRGGWETNYVITHSNMFAAAMSSAGFCNYISLYNGVRTPAIGGYSRQYTYEKTVQRIGSTLWERPDLFIENSPIFSADKVKTPLLMMNNRGDIDVPFEQGVEFFTALRRLKKTVWMLQYDNGDHLVSGTDCKDLEIRMKQFFDHYLKGAPPPQWMTKTIPATQKGKDLGYQLDLEGHCSKTCSVCQKKAL